MSGEAKESTQATFSRVKRATSAFSSFKTQNASLSTRPNGVYADLYTSPVPAVREIVQSTHTGFCEFHRGRRVKNNRVPTSVFIKNVLAIMQREDKQVAILCYEESDPVNSICHPSQVPEESDLFQKYFPRAYSSKGTLTVKCRLTSSVDLGTLKKRIFHSLEKYDYFVWPSQLRAVRTGKIGWLYLAHPDLTHRGEIVQVMKPLVNTYFNKDIEFQAVPEIEAITVGEKTIKQRVLCIRCPHDSLEEMRGFFTEAFSNTSSLMIKYLARYTFISNNPLGNITWSRLQSILMMQQSFHKNVYWFNVFGLHNIDTEFALLTQENGQDGESFPVSQEHESSGDEVMENVEQVNANSNMDKEDKMSLRYYMYSLLNNHNQNLIHAVYQSADDKKIFVLCSRTNIDSTLQVLHDIENVIARVFVPEALATYAPKNPDGRGPYVKDHPKMTTAYNSYVDNLIDLTSSVNPQESQVSSVSSYASSVTQNKRHHTGAPKAQVHQSNLPQGFNESNQKNVELQSTITETISRLKTVESNAVENTETLHDLSSRLDTATKDIYAMGAAIKTQSESLAEVQKAQIVVQREQVLQGTTMREMKSEQSQIFSMLQQLVKSASPPHGDEGGNAS